MHPGTRRHRLPPETVLLERQIEAINRFPDQNPNPVMRMTDDGHLVYANPASGPILEALGVAVDDHVPDDLLAALARAAADPARQPVEIQSGWQTYAVLPVPVPELGFINLYGTDVTAAKVLDRFPAANPNPVIRVSEEGRLIYANQASGRLTRALACAIGQSLPADVFERILAAVDAADAVDDVDALDAAAPRPIEIQSEGHTYALVPVRIPEFAFINVYGTDVTALKAIDKFPDQNPNPVLRLSREGSLLYANQAAAPLVRAFRAAVGGPLPPELQREFLACLEPGANATMEVEADGRIFSLLVRAIYEFGFINVYGTDVTAARAVEIAHQENERLLLNILPAPIAERLRRGERIIADRFEEVTLLFADIVEFTQLSSRMSAGEVVGVLNEVFSLFDQLVERHDLEKIKTIGDSYMVVGGLPNQEGEHTARAADMALELNAEVARLPAAMTHNIRFRVGIHAGPAVAGVIGVRKFIYDVWGDTVNTASRMESHGAPGRIHVTRAVYERLRETHAFEPRGVIDIRGKGPMPTWFLTGRSAVAVGDASSAAAGSPRRAAGRTT